MRFVFDCQGALAVDRLPAGALFDAATNEVSWTPSLSAAGPFTLLVHDAGGRQTRVDGFVLDRFDAEGNQPVDNRAEYTYEHGLPVVHLTWHADDPGFCQDGVARDSVPADVTLLGHAYQGAELRCRGKTSIKFPKKNFSLRFSKDDPFRAPPGLEQFDGARRLSLTQTFDDNSQIRSRMSFELYRRLDGGNVHLDQASVVVFVDGRYHGLYQLTDNVGSHFLERRGLGGDGQLFQANEHQANYKTTFNGALKSPLHFGYEKEEGEPSDDFTDLEELLRWTTDSNDAEFAASFDSMLRGDDFLDWYIFTTAIIADDNYGKNSYVYRDSQGADRRFRYIPWDLNESWGQNWVTARVTPDARGAFPPIASARNGIWERVVAIPALRERLRERYRAALAGPLSRMNVLAMFDAMHAEVRPSALRDDRRWDAARRAYPLFAEREDFTTFDGEMLYLRSWIEQRWQLLETMYASP